MYVSDKLVFVELHKTGGTHIGRWLSRLVPGEQIGKHNRVPLNLRDRFVIGSVRNPWDWYVSLWAYGCAGKGSVRQQVTRRIDVQYLIRSLGAEMGRSDWAVGLMLRQAIADLKKPVRRWSATYDDPDDAEAFRTWLRLILDPDRRFDMAEGYGFSPVSRWAGIFSYRYLKLFSGLDDLLYRDHTLATHAGTQAAFERYQLVDFVVRNEHLEADLLEALRATGGTVPDAEREELLRASSKRTNASVRRHTSYYFDEATRALVAERERFIIERHSYSAPSLEAT